MVTDSSHVVMRTLGKTVSAINPPHVVIQALGIKTVLTINPPCIVIPAPEPVPRRPLHYEYLPVVKT
jgi:hypothetical protein